ncbi:MAG: sugar ABC transporter permease [Oscillospiraceae bacterium]|nr:sugar ABC transporter permease [Oscillospiraceae bacterium]
MNNKLKKPGPLSSLFFFEALREGGAQARLSLLIFGYGSLMKKQLGRFVLFIAAEVGYIAYMAANGVKSLQNMSSLGVVEQTEVYNAAKGIYEYPHGDNSMLFLLYGVVTIMVTLVFLCVMMASARCSYSSDLLIKEGKKLPTLREDIRSLLDGNLHKLFLTWPVFGVLMFTIIPLIFMILIAFTSFDRNHQPPGNLFEWVGMSNFSAMFSSGGSLAQTFWPILSWTLIWAVFATSTNYILGMLLAIVINRKGTRFKSFWRFTFVLSIAMPAFVSLLTMRTIFSSNGAFNILLRNVGLLAETGSFDYFGDPLVAKIMIVLVNIWIGVPFTLLTTTGILKNIPAELYEAAQVDGSGPAHTFFKITLPYIIFITTPYLITTFVGNINNFNVIFLLTGGGPESLEYYHAGKTDLLVTWLYKLTIQHKDYNLGSVISILVFILMATTSLLAYRFTGAYKNEEEFKK